MNHPAYNAVALMSIGYTVVSLIRAAMNAAAEAILNVAVARSYLAKHARRQAIVDNIEINPPRQDAKQPWGDTNFYPRKKAV